MKKKNLIPLLSLIVILLSSCSKSAIENTVESLTPDIETPEDNNDADDDDMDENNDDETGDDLPVPTFTALINNNEFEATLLISQSLTGARINTLPFGYSLTITGQYISQDLKNSALIVLNAFGTDIEELATNSEFNSVTNIVLPQAPGAYALYAEDPNTDIDDDEIGSNITEEILIKITAIDKENLLISGEFNFIGTNQDTEERYEVKEGIFTNLSYEVQ